VNIDYSLMLAAAEEAGEMEACGVVLHDGRVLVVKNVAGRPGLFEMDAAELVAIYEEHGDIDGVWHSHPQGKTYPSDEDLEAHPSGKMMFIVADGGVHYHGRP
jgi:proteasome lid subunit RPN8/RPN11